MRPISTLFVIPIGLCLATIPGARADVIYSVINPSQNFVFFVYDSPGFITTDTVVAGSALAFNNTVHPATSVDFVLSSLLDPGFADVQISIDPVAAAAAGLPDPQDKFILPADLGQHGTYQFAAGSFGYPNSFLTVAAPEPGTFGLFSVGLSAVFVLRSRIRGRRSGG